MLRDNDIFPVHLQVQPNLDGLGDDDGIAGGFQTQLYPNDDLDDVFGSAPGSPAFYSDEEMSRGGNINGARQSGYTEQSDIPRIKEKHRTEGYRDGVTKGKGESVQKGFDEGYSLGAMLGLRAGKILGLLEGIVNGVKAGKEEDWARERERVQELWKAVKAELDTKSIFGPEWWGEDGIWKFVVEGEEEREVTFRDVVEAHPLIQKWDRVLVQECKRWGLDLGILDEREEEAEMMEGAFKGTDLTKAEERATLKENTFTAADAAETKSAEAPAKLDSAGNIMGFAKKDLNW